MTAPLEPRDTSTVLTDHETRIKRLELLLGRLGGGVGFDDEQTFNLSGALFVSESVRWYPPVAITVVSYVASLDTAGSSTTTVVFKVNGSTKKTITLTSGESFEAGESVFAAGTGDYMQVAVTGVGTNAADLDVQLRYRRSIR